MIAVSIGHSLAGTDFVVDAFDSASGDGKVVLVQDTGSVPFEGVGHCLQDPNTGCSSAGTPVGKEHTSGQFVGLLPDLTEVWT
jgi:V8-like Glu-specific endopeptidase